MTALKKWTTKYSVFSVVVNRYACIRIGFLSVKAELWLSGRLGFQFLSAHVDGYRCSLPWLPLLTHYVPKIYQMSIFHV